MFKSAVNCGHCGKTVTINEAILFAGRAFCGRNCKEESFKLEL